MQLQLLPGRLRSAAGGGPPQRPAAGLQRAFGTTRSGSIGISSSRARRAVLPARAAAGLGGGAASGGGGSGSDRSEHHLMKALSSTDRAGSDYGEVRC